MKRIQPQPEWPEAWRRSFDYDLQEIYGVVQYVGYANSYRNRAATTYRLIEEVLPIGSRVLDVAAAQGNFSIGLAERGYRVVWNDLRLELARLRRVKAGKWRDHIRAGKCLRTRVWGGIRRGPGYGNHRACHRLALFTNPLSAGHLKLERVLKCLPQWLVANLEAASTRLPACFVRRAMTHTAARFRKVGGPRPA